ncbi:MAG: hypothetical protein CM1200mP16_05100 [Nitrospina sp.]|nr:MAG: hypothetical protein CM1200mP16_05100 [Nitrospina sp.]
MIGEIQENGQFDVVWKTDGPIRAQAWSPFIPDSKEKVADWTYPWVCGTAKSLSLVRKNLFQFPTILVTSSKFVASSKVGLGKLGEIVV